MLRIFPRKIGVKNFKSLRDVEIDLTKVNIVIGPNGSGKTSLVEALYLLKLIVEHVRGRVINPFLEWWGYQEVVWNHDEKLNIELCVGFDIEFGPEGFLSKLIKKFENTDHLSLKNVSYRISVTGKGGRFQILREEIGFRNLKVISEMGAYKVMFSGKEFPIGEDIYEPTFLHLVFEGMRLYMHEDPESRVEHVIEHLRGNYALLPNNIDGIYDLALPVILTSIYALMDSMAILRIVNYDAMKEPSKHIAVEALSMDASNLPSLILTLYGGNIPDNVISSIAYILGEDEKRIKLGIRPTTDGRSFLTLTIGNIEHLPPSIPDGVLKMLAMEIAIDQRVPLLVVDEIENSLHAKAIHRLLDDIRNSSTTLLATTHSPAVIDIVKPEEIIILERKDTETTASRISDPKKLSNKLKDLGVTLSEYLTYIRP